MTGVDVEMVGGPADGYQMTVEDPAPPRIVIATAPPMPPVWVDDDLSAEPVPIRTTDYRRRDTWNPRTRRRQYVPC